MNTPDTSQTSPEQLAEIARRAQDALAEGKYLESLELFELALKGGDRRQELEFGRVLALFKLERAREAEASLRLLCEQHSAFEEARKLLYRIAHPEAELAPPFRVMKARDWSAAAPHRGTWKELPRWGSTAAPLHLSIVQGVKICGPHALVIAPGHVLLEESASDFTLDHATELVRLERQYEDTPQLSCGEFLPLYGVWSENFFHWMLEWLPRILLAEELGFKGTYVVREPARFVRETFDLLGIPPHRVATVRDEVWAPESLWLFDVLPSYYLGNYPAVLELLRAKLLAGAAKVEAPVKSERVYARRLDPTRPRRVVNEEELNTTLVRQGFAPIILESYPLSQQLALMAQARALLAPHGAAMVFALFMQPRSLVIELFSPRYINPCMLAACRLLRHRYHQVLPSVNNQPYQYGQDIFAPLEVIQTILDAP